MHPINWLIGLALNLKSAVSECVSPPPPFFLSTMQKRRSWVSHEPLLASKRTTSRDEDLKGCQIMAAKLLETIASFRNYPQIDAGKAKSVVCSQSRFDEKHRHQGLQSSDHYLPTPRHWDCWLWSSAGKLTLLLFWLPSQFGISRGTIFPHTRGGFKS